MPLTQDFKDTIARRAKRDPEFANALMQEGVQLLLDGDVETGTAILRDYINATIGFVELAQSTGTNSKSLMRMFSKTGNPQARKLFPVIAKLQEWSGTHLHVAVD